MERDVLPPSWKAGARFEGVVGAGPPQPVRWALTVTLSAPPISWSADPSRGRSLLSLLIESGFVYWSGRFTRLVS